MKYERWAATPVTPTPPAKAHCQLFFPDFSTECLNHGHPICQTCLSYFNTECLIHGHPICQTCLSYFSTECLNHGHPICFFYLRALGCCQRPDSQGPHTSAPLDHISNIFAGACAFPSVWHLNNKEPPGRGSAGACRRLLLSTLY